MTRRAALGQALAAAVTAPADEGQEFFLRLTKANDGSVAGLLAQGSSGTGAARVGRGGNLAALTSAYCSPESKFHGADQLVAPMERAAQAFLAAQDADGLMDAGNLSSPPDTGFVVEAISGALTVARRRKDERLANVEERLGRFLKKAGEGIRTGGIHTPNHRWVVCAAMARIHSLLPDPRLVERIDEWLGEGIYQDADGQFPERSPNYARVEVNAFVTLARLLGRPRLLEPARRYLTANLWLLQPDGELECVHSRRQDQDRAVHVANFYLQYRYLAIVDRNPAFAAVARLVAARPGEGFIEGANPVLQFLEEPLLRQPLPEGGTVPESYEKLFANSHLRRVRRGTRAATIFGGDDRPAGIASGLAHNPTFFRYRSGQAVLDSVRMGGQFFSLGVFRAQGLQVEGARSVLGQRLEAPYYQPLPKQFRRADGDYALTPVRDGRFFSKLDFPHRAVSNVQVLEQKVTITERDGGFDLDVEVTGRERVPYVVELAFRPGGKFEGAFEEVRGALFLKEGTGVYRVGGDAIEFGPGLKEHEMVSLSGHTYQAHGAQLKAAGQCVYVTGFTPLRRMLRIRGL